MKGKSRAPAPVKSRQLNLLASACPIPKSLQLLRFYGCSSSWSQLRQNGILPRLAASSFYFPPGPVKAVLFEVAKWIFLLPFLKVTGS